MSDGAPDLVVRAATAADLAAVAALGFEVQELHFAARPDLFTAPNSADIEAFQASAIAQPDHHLLVAVRGQAVLGFALCERKERRATPFRHATAILYLHQVAVAAHAQRSGVATALLAACDSLARAAAATWLQLDSWNFNSAAQEYFTGQGFAEMNTIFERRVP